MSSYSEDERRLDEVKELVAIYEKEVEELREESGTGFPLTEQRRMLNIAFKSGFIKDLREILYDEEKGEN